MSGLINSVGSRSGVLGTTELDYEEGTWTPGPSCYTGGLIDATVTTHVGNYTKIGNMVTVNCNINISELGGQGSSYTYVSGLPFETSATRNGTGAVGSNTCFTTTVIPTCFVGTSSRVYFLPNTNTATTASLVWCNGDLSFSLTYGI